jgi:ferredoxin
MFQSITATNMIVRTAKRSINSALYRQSLSTVAANTIRLTFVDQEGNRAVVPARVGQTLLDAAKMHKVDIEGTCGGGGAPATVRRTKDWEEIVFGEGPSCFFCHVQIPSMYNSVLPELSEGEKEGLEGIWEEEYAPTSRLACMITLTKSHDGMIVLVPDAPIVDLI